MSFDPKREDKESSTPSASFTGSGTPSERGSNTMMDGSFDERTASGEAMRNVFDDTPQQLSPSRARIYSEEDEEIRMAKAMALAIQNNPDMTPDEVRMLVARENTAIAQQNQLVQQSVSKKQSSDSSTGLAKNIQDSFHASTEKAKQRFKGMVTGTPAATTPTSTTTSSVVSSPHHVSFEENKNTLSISPTASTPPALVVETAEGSTNKSRATKVSTTSPLSPLTTSNKSVSSSSPQPPPQSSITADASGSPVPSLPVSSEIKDTSPIHNKTGSFDLKTGSFDLSSKVRLNAVLWKRRSGLGKLSAKHAWERRRVVLAGTKVLYFKAPEEEQDASEQVDNDVTSTNNLDSSTTGNIPAAADDNRRTTLWEQAAMNLEKARASLALDSLSSSNTDANTPRGSLDLVKEEATVAATTGHSGAPTPFCLSIKVRGETKWKFCFDSHKVQMEWLAAMTDVVVVSSLDSYNKALVEAADPSHQHDPALFHASAGSLSEPAPTGDVSAAAGHRLWMIDDYTITSREGLVAAEEEVKKEDTDKVVVVEEEDDMMEELDITAETVVTTGSFLSDGTTLSLAEEPWTLRDKNLYIMVVMLNTALFYSHASSTGIDKFWYLVTFVNLSLWLFLEKETTEEQKGGKNLRKSVALSSKDAARARVTSAEIKRRGVNKVMVEVSPRELAKVKPVAGTTTMQVENPTDVPKNKDGHIFGGWRAPPGSTIMVRSHGYLATKEKIPSPGEMYKCAYVDIFESPNRIPDMAGRVKLPKVDFDDDGATKTWHAPDVFVICVALPTDPPKMGRSSNDGGGYTITMYYTMKKETREVLKRVTAPEYDPSQEKFDDIQKSQVNAIKLLDAWCRRAPTDPAFQGRFKLIANAQNLKEIGVPNWIAKYNGKPVLIKRAGQTGFVYSHPELHAMEFDLSFHPFPYLAKQGICYLKENFFKKVLCTFGFVIEGRSDDELPECLIGCMQICYPDPIYSIQAEDFFNGTSPKSFEG